MIAAGASTLAAFRDAHRGETIIVCGCGASLAELERPDDFVTIGVNDVGRRFDPDYLVVVNPPEQFTGDRFRWVVDSRARHLFTQLDLPVPHPGVVKFSLGTYGGTDCWSDDVLHYTRNSPYVALCLAAYMGAARIGLIGVDFTEHHFFAPTGSHPLASLLPEIDGEYRRLASALKARGVEVYNLSRQSRLTALPKLSVGELAAPRAARARPSGLRLVSYATTPVAGVPAILARCITARTPHGCRCVWAYAAYDNGVAFDGDIEWSVSPAEADAVLDAAEVVIVHNGKVEPRHRALLEGKAVVTLAHNYGWNVDTALVDRGFPGLVVGQYQATLPEFAGWTAVPNPVPLWEAPFQPGDKTSTLGICYTPSGRHERYARDHRLYWHSKGYETTMRVLDELAADYPVRIEALASGQVRHADALAMKRRSHIVVDECVTGSYHRNSLEGLATGCVVVNGMGLEPAVVEALVRCTDPDVRVPFVRAGLADLRAVLSALIGRGRETLVASGMANRRWMEAHWDFGRQWERFWMPAVDAALRRRGTMSVGACRPRAVSAEIDRRTSRWSALTDTDPDLPRPGRREDAGVSVVIPHGGSDRLPHLAATLANLFRCESVAEVIVAEIGATPLADALARHWGAKYVFAWSTGDFERARALNMGSALASSDLILWKDNDLLMGPDFAARAAGEAREWGFDYLVPYASIGYLSESDTRDVLAGTADRSVLSPLKTLRSGRDVSGGSGLVRKDFITRYGGMPEGFKGWGGEDNAWMHKVTLLGRWGVTRQSEQHLHHLFHPGSGAYRGGPPSNDPTYAANVRLLHEIKAIRSAAEFLERFPPPSPSCPWPRDRRIRLVTSRAAAPPLARRSAAIADAFRTLLDVAIERHDLDDAAARHDDAPDAPDAVVVLGRAPARTWGSRPSGQKLRSRTVVVLETAADDGDADLRDTFAILAPSSRAAAGPARDGARWWPCPLPADGDVALVVALVQPLSLVLGAADVVRSLNGRDAPMPSRPGHDTATVQIARPATADTTAVARAEVASSAHATTRTSSERHAALPVWTYWEGDRPEWIAQCERTVLAHAADVRRLSWADFDRLWDRDRDIDIRRLGVAHRADFIRAFLLARFGGLWIDADCVVMQSLEPTLESLRAIDFVGHRDRQGFVPNGFMGASRGSVIAGALYRRVCEVLRSGRPIGWISLGGEPLTEILAATDVPWHELPCEAIQPVCWSRPDVFFEVGTADDHERRRDTGALCYMLSNSELRRFEAAYPGRDLLDPGTFFRHLVSRALEPSTATVHGAPSTPVESTRLPARQATTFHHLPFYLDVVAELNPARMLEVGMSRGHWGMLVRELADAPGALDPSLWLDAIRDAPMQGGSAASLYDRILTGDADEVLGRASERWDLAVFTRPLDLWPRDRGEGMLRHALAAADYVLVTSGLADRDAGDGPRSGRDRWSLCDFLAMDPVRLEAENATGVFLLSSSDPRRLRNASPMQRVFRETFLSNLRRGGESVSGPGSGLGQTAEIRRQLPVALQQLGVRVLLDAPCGDFNWMKTVALGVEQYVGVDVVGDIVELNRERYAAPGRLFLRLDLTADPLPRADLVLCRDCLGHFPTRDVLRALANFRRSGARWLMTTTFPTVDANRDIVTGDWRPVNLERRPFNFPPPVMLINEHCTEAGGRYGDKSLGVWRLQDLGDSAPG